MKSRPILFNGAMVRAILNGTKTQTRRPVKPEWQHFASACQLPDSVEVEDNGSMTFPGRTEASFLFHNGIPVRDGEWQPVNCQFGQPGDRLWVRETFAFTDAHEPMHEGSIEYRADNKVLAVDCQTLIDTPHSCDPRPFCGPWTPSIHMPRWASRILLEIVSVRVERLNDISEADARAEGIDFSDIAPGTSPLSSGFKATARGAYARLWELINGAGSWAANPWVWVLNFKPVPA